eukprot:gene3421-13466_t
MKKRTIGEPGEGTVTIVITRIEFYDMLMEDAPEARDQVVNLVGNLIRKCCWSCFAHVVDEKEGQYTLVFREVMDAATFCLQVQQALMKQPWPDGLFDEDTYGTKRKIKKKRSKFFSWVPEIAKTLGRSSRSSRSSAPACTLSHQTPNSSQFGDAVDTRVHRSFAPVQLGTNLGSEVSGTLPSTPTFLAHVKGSLPSSGSLRLPKPTFFGAVRNSTGGVRKALHSLHSRTNSTAANGSHGKDGFDFLEALKDTAVGPPSVRSTSPDNDLSRRRSGQSNQSFLTSHLSSQHSGELIFPSEAASGKSRNSAFTQASRKSLVPGSKRPQTAFEHAMQQEEGLSKEGHREWLEAAASVRLSAGQLSSFSRNNSALGMRRIGSSSNSDFEYGHRSSRTSRTSAIMRSAYFKGHVTQADVNNQLVATEDSDFGREISRNSVLSVGSFKSNMEFDFGDAPDLAGMSSYGGDGNSIVAYASAMSVASMTPKSVRNKALSFHPFLNAFLLFANGNSIVADASAVSVASMTSKSVRNKALSFHPFLNAFLLFADEKSQVAYASAMSVASMTPKSVRNKALSFHPFLNAFLLFADGNSIVADASAMSVASMIQKSVGNKALSCHPFLNAFLLFADGNSIVADASAVSVASMTSKSVRNKALSFHPFLNAFLLFADEKSKVAYASAMSVASMTPKSVRNKALSFHPFLNAFLLFADGNSIAADASAMSVASMTPKSVRNKALSFHPFLNAFLLFADGNSIVADASAMSVASMTPKSVRNKALSFHPFLNAFLLFADGNSIVAEASAMSVASMILKSVGNKALSCHPLLNSFLLFADEKSKVAYASAVSVASMTSKSVRNKALSFHPFLKAFLFFADGNSIVADASAVNMIQRSVGNKAASALFLGLRLGMGVATGSLQQGQSLKSSELHELAITLVEASSGGQVLLCERTFLCIKERLEELGAVDEEGLDFAKLQAKKTLWTKLSQAQRASTAGAGQAPVLDMGTYTYTKKGEIPIVLTVPEAEPEQRLSRQSSHNSLGSLTSRLSRQSSWGKKKDKKKDENRTQHRFQILATALVLCLHRIDYNCFKKKKDKKKEEKRTLHIYQILAPALVQRAKVFENSLSIAPDWVCTEPAYFSAPGK